MINEITEKEYAILILVKINFANKNHLLLERVGFDYFENNFRSKLRLVKIL